MKLSQQVIVISHAGNGIEQSLALYLANLGADLALIDHDSHGLAETMNLCSGVQGKVRAYVAAETDAAAAKAVFREIVRDFGHVDVFIDSLGIGADGHLVRTALGYQQVTVNQESEAPLPEDSLFQSLVYCRQAAIQLINSERRGLIINLLGKHRKESRVYSHYRRARSELEEVISLWAQHLQPHAIRIMGVVPEFVFSALLSGQEHEAAEPCRISLPETQRCKALAEVVVSLIDNPVSGSLVDIRRGTQLAS